MVRHVSQRAVFMVLLFVASVVPTFAQSDEQQSFLAKLISRTLSSPDDAVRIGAVEGVLSSNAVIRDIEVSDAQGPWLRVDRVQLVWKRAALLLGRLEVERLEIAHIDISRKPVRPTARERAAERDASLLPDLPVTVLISAFTIGELALGESVAGVAARIGINGHARLGESVDGLHAGLSARRLDQEGLSELRLSFVPQGKMLEIVLRHREGANGLLAHLLNIEGRPAVDLDLSGNGPLDNWQAKLTFAAGQVAQATGRAAILRQGTGRRYDLDIEGLIEGLLPPLAATIFSGQTKLTGAMTVADDGTLAVSGLRLGSQQAELSVSGTLSKERQLDVQAVARALARGGHDPRVSALNSLNLDLHATGALTAPVIRGRLETEIGRLAAFADDLGLPVKGALKLRAEIAGSPKDKVLDATFSADAHGLDFGQPNLSAIFGGHTALSGTARLRGDEMTAESISLKGQRIDTVLDAKFNQFGRGMEGALRLMGRMDGRQLAGATRFAQTSDGAFDLSGLDVTLGKNTLRGALRIAGDGLMTGALLANLPDLASLSWLAGSPLRGALSGDAQFSAKQDVQVATVKAKGSALAGFGTSAATLEAEAQVSGTLARPSGTFRASISGLQHPAAMRAGLARIAVTSSGSLAGDHALVDVSLSGGPYLQLKIKGAAPFSETGKLALAVTGQIDAALANSRLTGGTQRMTGRVVLDAHVRGSVVRPALEGAATLTNGSFVDVLQGIRLTGVNGRIHGAGQMLRIDSLTGATPGGGKVTISGSVEANPARGFPANLRLSGENAQLIDNGVVDMVAGLDLMVSGPLAGSPLVTGDVRIASFDVAIPDKLPADTAPLTKARHLSAPEHTRERLKALDREARRKTSRSKATSGGPRLAIRVTAPSHIFVRGRGIDAELGGELTLSGPLFMPRANGAFELRRGQINMLTQRLEFSRGRLTFFGDLTPELDFVAATSAGGVTAKVSVTGHADAPIFTLSSEPQLPPDEVLSRLMFERATGSLSPLQAVQLAQAVARLSGRGGTDVVDKVRQALGVDTLDVSADKDGPTVGASRYITRGVRLGVKAGATPEQSGVTANIDVGRRIKLQGETSASGKASVGISAEIEY